MKAAFAVTGALALFVSAPAFAQMSQPTTPSQSNTAPSQPGTTETGAPMPKSGAAGNTPPGSASQTSDTPKASGKKHKGHGSKSNGSMSNTPSGSSSNSNSMTPPTT